MEQGQKNRTIIITSLLTIVAGIVVMAGWIYDIPALETMIHGFVAMSFNSALCLVLFACALLITQYPPGKHSNLIFFILSLLGTLIGLVTLSQDLFHYNSGLDQLFVTDKTRPSYDFPYPGRMAFNASICFTLLGLGFIALIPKKRIFNLLSQTFFHLVTILSATALIGYLYGVSFFRVVLYRTSMATHTAVLFFILSIAASLLNPEIGITQLFTGKRVGNQMARRLFTLMILMIIVFGSLTNQTHRFQAFSSLDIGVSVLAVCFLLVSLLLIWNTANWLNKVDKQRSKAEEEVKWMNLELEKIVEERTAEFQKSEEKYHSLIEQASDAIYVLDFRGNFADVNASMCKMMGYTCEELLHMQIEMIIDPEELKHDPIPARIKHAAQSTIRERRFIRKDRSVFTAEVNVKKFADDRTMVIARDITGRKKMETELREAELKFRTIADKSIVGVYIVQRGKFVYINPRFAEVFGYEPEELIGTFSVETIIHESYRQTVTENVRLRVEGDVESVHYEALGLRKDGTTNWVEFYGTRTILGNEITIIGSLIDITERKKTEEELKTSEQKYKLLFESNPSPMWMIAKDDLSIIAVNDAAARLYGYSKEELLCMNVSAFRTKDDLESLPERYRRDTEGYVEPLVIKHIKKNGTTMFVEIIAYDIVFEGRPVRLSLTNDITDRKNAEENLKKAYERIQSHIESIKDMAWKQSHLIRSPLANLKGLTSLLKEDPLETTIFDHIQTELNRMDTILIEMADEASDHDFDD
ncbi:PAS domain-containing protein [Mucilaginibacter gotjawali]|uniref:histidine kinase n=2 Tax=Mucilaginibacter gotjawali TaxID=1550579 RepID=A0A0X8X495_9SPHI|nr:PAS domain-containing protein [Mucilaginibacter gotjawali]MBB3057528.1 PAS domain S-box-containing protein [Mucilaginibacter gotjawali]BAU55351.1 Sporulation kinase E [Mucilaginibacter gotjawali]